MFFFCSNHQSARTQLETWGPDEAAFRWKSLSYFEHFVLRSVWRVPSFRSAKFVGGPFGTKEMEVLAWNGKNITEIVWVPYGENGFGFCQKTEVKLESQKSQNECEDFLYPSEKNYEIATPSIFGLNVLINNAYIYSVFGRGFLFLFKQTNLLSFFFNSPSPKRKTHPTKKVLKNPSPLLGFWWRWSSSSHYRDSKWRMFRRLPRWRCANCHVSPPRNSQPYEGIMVIGRP